MSRMIGTVSRGVRAPIIRSGDDLASIVTSSVIEAANDEGVELRDKDIVAMTEAIVARAQGNYASVDDIANDIKTKFPEGAYQMAKQVLIDHKEGMTQLAELLLEREVVFTEDVERIFGKRKKDILREQREAEQKAKAEAEKAAESVAAEVVTEQAATDEPATAEPQNDAQEEQNETSLG